MHQDSCHRFHLDRSTPRRKHECPQCHDRRSLVLFVDEEGQYTSEFAAHHVGICDHKNRCGYDKRPKDYFADHPEMQLTKRDFQPRPKPTPIPPTPMLTYEPELMSATMKGYEHNVLFGFLARMIGEAEAMRIFRMYNVGTAKMMGWSTVFWQVDIEGRIRTGKVMKYSDDAHRVKTEGVPSFDWIHHIVKRPGFQMLQCFFGEHLLATRPGAKVVIVESEKSVLFISPYFPDYVIIASGGKDGTLNATASQVLKGRDVKLLPDLGMEDYWFKKAEMLRPICQSVEVLTWLSNQATEEQRARGLDVADFIVAAVLPPRVEVPLSEGVSESATPYYDPTEWPWPPPDPNEVCPF